MAIHLRHQQPPVCHPNSISCGTIRSHKMAPYRLPATSPGVVGFQRENVCMIFSSVLQVNRYGHSPGDIVYNISLNK